MNLNYILHFWITEANQRVYCNHTWIKTTPESTTIRSEHDYFQIDTLRRQRTH